MSTHSDSSSSVDTVLFDDKDSIYNCIDSSIFDTSGPPNVTAPSTIPSTMRIPDCPEVKNKKKTSGSGGKMKSPKKGKILVSS